MTPSRIFFSLLVPSAALASLAACAGSSGQSGSQSLGIGSPGLVASAQTHAGVAAKAKKTRKGLYVASYGGNDIDIYSEKTGGGVIGSLGGSFFEPQGIYIDASGTIYVGDTNNDRVQVYASGSTTPTQSLTDNGQPREVTGDSNGTIYAGNVNQGNVAVYSSGATSPTSYLTVPNAVSVLGIAVDKNNDLYVSYNTQAGGNGSGQVDEFLAGSTTPINLGITLVSASALAIDAKQDIIVCDSADSDQSQAAVYVFPQGQTKPSLTLSLPNAYPLGVALSENGKTLYVGEADSDQVQAFTYPKLKLVATIATTGGYPNNIAVFPPAAP